MKFLTTLLLFAATTYAHCNSPSLTISRLLTI